MKYSALVLSLTLWFSMGLSTGVSATADDHGKFDPKPYVTVKHPDWSKNAVFYQINTRQFTKEGTFKAAQKQLPRLKDLGVDILWLMPIHPIGKKNRKGSLGSPYSVQDYFKVNPELGTLDDLKNFVAKAHSLGMRVILDWVANHTAWDNVIMKDHPDWYERDYKGDFRPTPWWDWSDIIDLDYSKPALRQYMTEALKYWVKEVNIDGYRCDVAGFVPIDFWETARAELDKIKPVFMLAEAHHRDLHRKAFDASYAWVWRESLLNIIHGQADVSKLFVYYSHNESEWPAEAYRMTYISNHDSNAWEGTMFESFGDALNVSIALSIIGEGMPLIYNGQEAGNDKRLAFFERDPIVWKPHPVGDLYKKLLALRKKNKALWNAQFGARMISVPNDHNSKVLSFVRQKDGHKVFAVMNLSKETQTVQFKEKLYHGSYVDFETGKTVTLSSDLSLTLPAWGYKIYSVSP